jgi:ABC-2 type transport system permease protein
LPAAIASWGMFEIITNATTLVSDILGDRVIEYELVLPIPQWAIFAKIALVNAYRAFIVSLLLIPAGMAIIYLGIGLTFSNINLFKTIFMILIANIFFGFLGLFTASLMQKISDVRNMWMRVLFPMWFVGGLNNSLSAVQKVAPIFAKALLLNPIVYISEGMRAAMLGQEGYLNYGLCCLVIIALTIFLAIFAVKRFQKNLDCL